MSDGAGDAGSAADSGRLGDVEWAADPERERDGEPGTDATADDSVIVLVGGLGGAVVGLVCTAVALLLTGSPWAAGVGALAWVLATGYLIRRRTLQKAVSTTGYVVASVLLLVPAVSLSPATAVDGGFEGREADAAVLFLFVTVPVILAVGIAWLASRYGASAESGRAR